MKTTSLIAAIREKKLQNNPGPLEETELPRDTDILEVYNHHRVLNGLEPTNDDLCLVEGHLYLRSRGYRERARTVSFQHQDEQRGTMFGITWMGHWHVTRFYRRQHADAHGPAFRHAVMKGGEKQDRDSNIRAALESGNTMEWTRIRYGGSWDNLKRIAAEVRAENDGLLPYEIMSHSKSGFQDLNTRCTAYLESIGVYHGQRTNGTRCWDGVLRRESPEVEARLGCRHIDPSDPSCANYQPPSAKKRVWIPVPFGGYRG